MRISLRAGETLADYAYRITDACEQGVEHIAGLRRELAEARALLTAVAESGVEWSTPGYVLVQIDRATWSAITGAPTRTPAPAVSGFDFSTEGPRG